MNTLRLLILVIRGKGNAYAETCVEGSVRTCVEGSVRRDKSGQDENVLLIRIKCLLLIIYKGK